MKTLIKSIILSLLLFNIADISASYCYHPLYQSELLLENGKLYILSTQKDHNGISYISQQKVPVSTDIDLTGFKVIGYMYDDGFIFSNKDAYYALKSWNDSPNGKQIEKLFDIAQVTDTMPGWFFRVNNVWRYVYANLYQDKIVSKSLPLLPKNVTQLSHYHDGFSHKQILRDKQNLYILNKENGDLKKYPVSTNGSEFEVMAESREGELLLKNTQCVYKFRRGELTIIPKLTPSQTKLVYNRYSDKNYLYDDNTFYEMSDSMTYKDITNEFNFLGVKSGFLTFRFTDSPSPVFYDADSTLWAYANLSMRDGPTVTFYPLKKATYVNEKLGYFLYEGKIYQGGWDAGYKINDISLDYVKQLERLSPFSPSYFLTDGDVLYYSKYSERKFQPIDWMTAKTKYVYGLGHINYFEENNKLFRIDNNKIDSTAQVINIDGPVKNFTLAIASRDHLLVEGRLLKNIANKDEMEFIGSTARIIRQCDNAGTPPVKIDFFYFFHDKEKVYYYYTGLKEMKILDGLRPYDYQADNYQDLKTLESYTNEEPIEEDRRLWEW